MIRRPPRSTQSRSSAASDVYKRQDLAAAPARTRNVVAGRIEGYHGCRDTAGPERGQSPNPTPLPRRCDDDCGHAAAKPRQAREKHLSQRSAAIALHRGKELHDLLALSGTSISRDADEAMSARSKADRPVLEDGVVGYRRGHSERLLDG